jgi:hypothetical protein
MPFSVIRYDLPLFNKISVMAPKFLPVLYKHDYATVVDVHFSILQ